MPQNFLITGATGNIGSAVIEHFQYSDELKVFAGVRNVGKQFTDKPATNIFFDFENLEKSADALKKADILFLLRPPHISDVEKIFRPLIDAAKKYNIKHIVFLSVQGVEKSSVIPHHKIEKVIRDSGIPWTFIRPAYFMQNLTGNLKKEIVDENKIYVPAGNAKFNWIDADDIGKATAMILQNTKAPKNQVFTITGNENFTFREVATIMSETFDQKITYKSPNILSYFIKKKKDGLPTPLIIVMIILHFLPRFQSAPEIFNDYKKLTNQEPTPLKAFLENHREEFGI